MPFTIGGDWVPSEEESKPNSKASSRPVKVRSVKRKKALLTLVLNLPEKVDVASMAAELKKACGCGGTVRDGVIELQGERVEQVRRELAARGVKAQ